MRNRLPIQSQQPRGPAVERQRIEARQESVDGRIARRPPQMIAGQPDTGVHQAQVGGTVVDEVPDGPVQFVVELRFFPAAGMPSVVLRRQRPHHVLAGSGDLRQGVGLQNGYRYQVVRKDDFRQMHFRRARAG